MSKPTQLNPTVSGFGCVGFFCFLTRMQARPVDYEENQ
jgi:hypothetical protein